MSRLSEPGHTDRGKTRVPSRPRNPRLAQAEDNAALACWRLAAVQEATFLILTALAAGSQHSNGIITDVQEISGSRVRLRAGTLYTALDRLRAEELIGLDREEVVENRLRRYYRLTPKGSALLAAETARRGPAYHHQGNTPLHGLRHAGNGPGRSSRS